MSFVIDSCSLSSPLCTGSSMIFALYRLFAMPKDTIYAVRDKHGPGAVRCSKGELEFTAFLTSIYSDKEKYGEMTIWTTRSHDRMPRVMGIIPDFMARNTDNTKFILGFFNG